MTLQIERVSAFIYGTQLAETFHVGNIFLAGEAAHRFTLAELCRGSGARGRYAAVESSMAPAQRPGCAEG
jgi:hypothetical protein